MHSGGRVISPTLFSGAEQEQTRDWCQGSGKPASGLESESQIELEVKAGLITKSLSGRCQELER